MTNKNWHSVTFLALLGALGAFGCASDDDGANDGAGGGPGDGCTTTLEPSSDDSTSLLGALIDAKSGDTICLEAGTYRFNREITLAGVDHVTLKGVGITRDDVILDFANQTDGDNAAEIDADFFTIQDLTIKDAPGDGVKVTQSESPVFRNIRAYWSAGPSSQNGTYALYPAQCSNVLIEDCEVESAADAGIYLGQSTTGVIRRNKAHQNVIGIEAENSVSVDIYENEAFNNSCGILVVNLPELPRKQNERIDVHDNIVRENDHPNFATPGAFVEGVPPGSGILVMASDSVHIHGNTIQNNGGSGVLVISWPTFSATDPAFNTGDQEYEQYSESVYIYDNTYTGNGNNPQGIYLALTDADGQGFDVIWDGVVDPDADPATADQRRFCLKEATGARFFDMGQTTIPVTDLTPYTCEYSPLPAVSLE